MKQSTLVIESAVASVVSTASAFNGEMIIAWVVFGINVLTLISNALLSIYKKWKHRDDEEDEK